MRPLAHLLHSHRCRGQFDTFEPRWIETRPVDNGGAIDVSRGSASARVTRRTPIRLEATVTASTAAELVLPVSHFPGWRVRIDGTEAPLDVPSPSGRIRVQIGPGAHQLTATFERTAVRWVADTISVIALLFVVAAVVWTRRATRTAAPRSDPASPP